MGCSCFSAKGHANGAHHAADGDSPRDINHFSYNELRSATDNFHSANKIGRGGFGTVYKGTLKSGRPVAVKTLSAQSKQGVREFLNEITIISKVRHPNLVELIGCCAQGTNRILVYEYVENNSLDRALLGPKDTNIKLDWGKRSVICLGIARGLAFLHEDLGLALPTHTIRGLDLNTYTFEPSKDAGGSSQLMINQASLQLGGPWQRACSDDDDNDDDDFSSNQQQKRSFSDAFEEITDVPRTLPLLLWNKQPNDDDDDDDLKDHQKSFHFAFNNVDGDSDGIVGWPPIKFRRKKISPRSKRNGDQNNQSVDNGCPDCHGKPSNSMYVKVKVEGDAIGRKIDLSLYDSFQDLKQTLLGMFGISQENSTSYKLTFQDRDGDWLLADDVSWRSFIWSVQRLKLMRSRCGSEQD